MAGLPTRSSLPWPGWRMGRALDSRRPRHSRRNGNPEPWLSSDMVGAGDARRVDGVPVASALLAPPVILVATGIQSPGCRPTWLGQGTRGGWTVYGASAVLSVEMALDSRLGENDGGLGAAVDDGSGCEVMEGVAGWPSGDGLGVRLAARRGLASGVGCFHQD